MTTEIEVRRLINDFVVSGTVRVPGHGGVSADQDTLFFLDTGSTANLVGDDYVRHHGLEIIPFPRGSRPRVTGADGGEFQQLEPEGWVRMEFRITSTEGRPLRAVSMTFIVVSGLARNPWAGADVCLGWDYVNAVRPLLRWIPPGIIKYEIPAHHVRQLAVQAFVVSGTVRVPGPSGVSADQDTPPGRVDSTVDSTVDTLFFLDTGSTANLVGSEFASRHRLDIHRFPEGTTPRFTGADGGEFQQLEPEGWVRMEFRITSTEGRPLRAVSMTFIVVSGLARNPWAGADVCLGWDYVNAVRPLLRWIPPGIIKYEIPAHHEVRQLAGRARVEGE